jgi:alanyl-tRNA synthetase
MQAKSAAIDEVGEVDGIKLFTQKIPGANANTLRQAGDKLRDAHTGFAAVLAGESNFLCVCDKSAVDGGLNAGKIVREIAAISGGKGGGKPDTAMAGIGDVSKVDEALSKFAEITRG